MRWLPRGQVAWPGGRFFLNRRGASTLDTVAKHSPAREKELETRQKKVWELKNGQTPEQLSDLLQRQLAAYDACAEA